MHFCEDRQGRQLAALQGLLIAVSVIDKPTWAPVKQSPREALY